MKKGFLWGGAVAAHQLEGGYCEGEKGLSIVDVVTAGSKDAPGGLPKGLCLGNITPTMKPLIFLPYLQRGHQAVCGAGFSMFPDKHCMDPDFSKWG